MVTNSQKTGSKPVNSEIQGLAFTIKHLQDGLASAATPPSAADRLKSFLCTKVELLNEHLNSKFQTLSLEDRVSEVLTRSYHALNSAAVGDQADARPQDHAEDYSSSAFDHFKTPCLTNAPRSSN